MKQSLFFILCFLTTNLLQAQEYTVVELDGQIKNLKPKISQECESKLAELKELCLKMYESPEAVKFRKLDTEFRNKIYNGQELLTDPSAANCSEQIIFLD